MIRYQLEYSQKNRDKTRRWKSEWAKRNKAAGAARTARYNSAKLQRCPKWLTQDQLNEIKYTYDKAQELTTASGAKYSVDHIVPLQGEIVSGLHVPWNLQVIPLIENCLKRNKFSGVA